MVLYYLSRYYTTSYTLYQNTFTSGISKVKRTSFSGDHYYINYDPKKVNEKTGYTHIACSGKDYQNVTQYLVKISEVINNDKANKKKYEEEHKKYTTIKTKNQTISTDPQKFNSTKSVKPEKKVLLYKKECIGYAPGSHYYNGKPDYYYLKPKSKISFTLANCELIRGTKFSNSESFMVVTEVLETMTNKKYSASQKKSMKGLWAHIIINGEEQTQDTTEEDVKKAKEAGEDTSDFSETMDLNGTSEGNNPNDIEQEAAPNYTSDEFLIEYEYDVASSSTSEYVKSLENSNYKLKIGNLRSIFGTPHQFLPKTDTRIVAGSQTNPCGEVSDIGRMYGEKILKNMPILYITPGSTKIIIRSFS